MALSDLAVYSEFAYTTMTEVLRQELDLFNEATNGAIVLRQEAHQGDYSDTVFFAKISGLVRRRNAYGSGAISQKVLQQLVDTMVKIAAGTAEIRIDPGQFKWIQMNPEEAGVALGKQLAVDTMADMLNTALGATKAALSGQASIITDVTGVTAPGNLFSFLNQNTGTSKFGDQGSQIVAWIMHSKPMFDLYGQALQNINQLYTFGAVNVQRDPFGRILVMTDSPALITAGSPNVYWEMGLTPGAVIVDQNNDYTAAEETRTGFENIVKTFQAEWSYSLGVKGFTWDKTNGGRSPTDAALFTATNWDKIVTSDKDLAGVLVKSN